MKYIKILSSWIKYLSGAFKPLFTSIAKVVKPKGSQLKDNQSDDENSIAIEFSADEIKQNFSFNEEGSHSSSNYEQVSLVGSSFMRIGYKDGILGKDKTLVETLAKTWVLNFRDSQKEKCDSKVKEYEGEVQIKKQLFEDAKSDYDLQQKHNHFLNKDYRRDSRKFSLFLGILYIVISLSLILADIPLALKLTQQGFDLDMDKENTVQMLFENPWEVFTGNWEVFILAIGIALCAIFIKIYYDEFIGTPVDKVVTELKNLNDVESEEEKKAAKIIKRRRFRAKTGLLCFSLATIILLGIFRFQTVQRIDREHRIASTSLSNNSFTFLEDENATAANLELPEQSFFEMGVNLLTFIFITLLFPIIGGICASLGLNHLHNRRILKRSRKLLSQSQTLFNKSKADLVSSEKEFIKWNNRQTWCKQEKFVNQISDFLYKCYLHGYETGYLSPEKAHGRGDIYSQAEELRRKKISRKILNVVKFNGNGSLNGKIY